MICICMTITTSPPLSQFKSVWRGDGSSRLRTSGNTPWRVRILTTGFWEGLCDGFRNNIQMASVSPHFTWRRFHYIRPWRLSRSDHPTINRSLSVVITICVSSGILDCSLTRWRLSKSSFCFCLNWALVCLNWGRYGQFGISCFLVCGTVVQIRLPINCSAGLHPHHGIGVARYESTARWGSDDCFNKAFMVWTIRLTCPLLCGKWGLLIVC